MAWRLCRKFLVMMAASCDVSWPWVGARSSSSIAARVLLSASRGGPGVGKTIIVNAILRILAAKGTSLLLCAPTGRSAKRFRQAALSRIITTAHRINQGSMPDLSPPGAESDFYFVQADDPEAAVGRIIELAKTRIPKRFGLDPVRNIQVLCPMNRGGVGARSLNIELQAALNPAGDRKVERFGWTFGPGDKVMQIENDYDKEVYNGDIGYIDDVDPVAGEIVVGFDGRSVTYGFGELDMLVRAYAAPIHKSQGSEFPP